MKFIHFLPIIFVLFLLSCQNEEPTEEVRRRSGKTERTNQYEWIDTTLVNVPYIQKLFQAKNPKPLTDSILLNLKLAPFIFRKQKVYPSQYLEFDSNWVFMFSTDLEDSEKNEYYQVYMSCVNNKNKVIGQHEVFVTGKILEITNLNDKVLHIYNSYIEESWNAEAEYNGPDSIRLNYFYFIDSQHFDRIEELDEELIDSLLYHTQNALDSDTLDAYLISKHEALLKELQDRKYVFKTLGSK